MYVVLNTYLNIVVKSIENINECKQKIPDKTLGSFNWKDLLSSMYNLQSTDALKDINRHQSTLQKLIYVLYMP